MGAVSGCVSSIDTREGDGEGERRPLIETKRAPLKGPCQIHLTPYSPRTHMRGAMDFHDTHCRESIIAGSPFGSPPSPFPPLIIRGYKRRGAAHHSLASLSSRDFFGPTIA